MFIIMCKRAKIHNVGSKVKGRISKPVLQENKNDYFLPPDTNMHLLPYYWRQLMIHVTYFHFQLCESFFKEATYLGSEIYLRQLLVMVDLFNF